MKNLDEIEKNIINIANLNNIPLNLCPTFRFNEGTARPEIKVDQLGYHYVISERGNVFENYITLDFDEILYRVFEDATFTLAMKQAMKNRIEGEDFRRQFFKIQEEMIKEIRESFYIKLCDKHKNILNQYPFSDNE